MKKLEFDLIQWHEAYKKIPKGFTSLQMRNLKKEYFKGDAFNTAFPLALIEMPQRWILDGVVEIEDGSEYEFSWRPDGILTFTDLIKNSGHAWSEKMQEAASAEYAVAIRCVAQVL